jgi:glycosyltransferase involved in cell wall biosynthesis
MEQKTNGLIQQFAHYPAGSGSYVVAHNLEKYVDTVGSIWALGDVSSGLFLDGVHGLVSVPASKDKKLLGEMTRDEYHAYVNTVSNNLPKQLESTAIVHHGFVIAKLLGKRTPVISYLHGSEMLAYEEGNLPDYVASDIQEGIASSKLVLVMSELQKLDVERLFGSSLQSEVIALGGGVDTSIFYQRDVDGRVKKRYNMNSGMSNIVFAGRYSPEKGLGTLLDAFSDEDFFAGKKLTIVGSDSLPQKVYEMAENLPGEVGFVDFLSQPDLADVMALADIVVVPSFYESFGLICIEALACGTPVVASNVGVLEKLVNPPDGGVIFKREKSSERSAENLRLAINEVLDNGRDISSYATEISRKYSWEVFSKRFSSVVDKVLVK